MQKLISVLFILSLLGACSEQEQQEISGAPKKTLEKAEQVQTQLDDLAEKQRQVIDQTEETGQQ
jgi:hypothetical protein